MARHLLLIALAFPHLALALNHETLRCLDCHARLSTTPEGWEERDWREWGICMSCHDGRGTVPDVIRDAPEMLAAGLITAEDGRSGGALHMQGDGSAGESAGYKEFFGHTIGSTEPPPGSRGRWPQGARLVCKACHAIHSNGNFRNLGRDPYLSDLEYLSTFAELYGEGALPTYAVVPEDFALEDAKTDVLILEAPGTAHGTYRTSRISYVVRSDRHAMNSFCGTCHSAFHGERDTNPGDGYVRHPTSGVAIGDAMRERLEGSAQRLRVSHRADGTTEVACLTCHRAHGTMNSFGLVHWDLTSSANGENGAGDAPESLCRSCHQMGR
jgi:hypothetical protein